MFKFPLKLLFTFIALMPSLVLAGDLNTSVLIFSEQEPGIEEPYQTRMLVTEEFLRFDDGGADDDFVLLNRKTRTIYSVSHEDERVVIIKDKKIDKSPPEPFRHSTEEGDSGGVPDIDGNAVRLFRFYTNGLMCFEVYAVQGFLDDAVKSMASFAEILARQHASTIDDIPAEFQTSCDLANNVFEPTRYLSKGFPVRQRDDIGRTRSLLSFKENIKKQSELFVIPSKYQMFYPGKTMI